MSSYIRKPLDDSNDGFWWVSTSFATFGVTVRGGKVARDVSAPITGKFIGQPFSALTAWVLKDPNATVSCIRPLGEPVVSEA